MKPLSCGLALLALAGMMAPLNAPAQTVPATWFLLPGDLPMGVYQYDAPVVVQVSSTYQLESVEGTFRGSGFTLRHADNTSLPQYVATLDLRDVPYGTFPVTVKVTDVLGHSSEVSKNVVVNKPPRIDFLKPQWGELFESCLHIVAVCIDDGPGCTAIGGLGARDKTRLDMSYHVPTFGDRLADFGFYAMDGQYYVPHELKLVTAPDGMLKTLRRVDWTVWDVDATRILSGNGRSIVLHRRDTGEVLVRAALASDATHAVLTPDGFLVARGQELELWREGQFTSLPPLRRGLPSVAGRHAAWVSEVEGAKEVVRLDTLTGELTHIQPLSDQEPDQPAVGDNGVVVFKDGTWLTVHDASGTHQLFEPPDATLAPSAPITDGVRFIYTTQNPAGVVLREGSTETLLAEGPVRPGTQYRIADGVVAFERNIRGLIQVFRMRLGEEPRQLTYFSHSSMLSGLAKNGTVTTVGVGDMLLHRLDGSSSPLYRSSIARELIGTDGERYVAAGGFVHAVVDQSGPVQPCEVETGQDGGVDAGVGGEEDAGVDAGMDAPQVAPEREPKSSGCAAVTGSAWVGLLVLGGLVSRRRRR